ncbi:HAD superfamily hydrolase [Enterococcus sp. 10A9_DIV0425]|uniref:HAD superfamily hydrolase n=1 Tax=Candidatus Enterococcus wittei TaxID=1987383 RepID=A0A242JXU5_9ENTE|nr:HAD family phosphatase [Enterococcus sp. 10A9_DIV0425]OTP10138.1 HAD superfamily hydrolase [Enterococcus sp. 10A9_DIV0425]THE14243.1 HAD family phosphatase [Enterococcus hirae]
MKGAIFDLDGLLVDTEKTYRDGWLWGFQQFDLTMSQEIVDAWGGKNWKQSYEILVDIAGSPEMVQKVREKREEYFYQQLESDAIQLKPHAIEVLKELKNRGLVLGLATTTVTKRATDILEHFALTPYFDTFTFGDEVSENKPSPVPYLTALEKSRLLPTEAFAVEDSLVGATSASRAGLGVVLIPDSSFNRNYSANDKANLLLLAEGKDLLAVLDMLDKSKN